MALNLPRKRVSRFPSYLRINLIDSSKQSIRDLDVAQNDGYRRYIHIDLSLKKDAVGMSMCHIPKYVEVMYTNAKTNVRGPVMLPYIKFDFTARFKAKNNGEIDLSQIREILIDLRDKYNYEIALITFDRYQSADSVQILRNLGFVVGHLSIDRTAYVIKVNYDRADFIEKITTDKNYAAPHEMFKLAIADGRIELPYVYPREETMIDEEREWSERREILSQEYDSIKNTVVKSFHGTDDWLQSVVGSICNAVTNELGGNLYNEINTNNEIIDGDPYNIDDPYSNYDLGDSYGAKIKFKKDFE